MLSVNETVLVIGPGAVGLSLAAGLLRAGIKTAILGRNASAQRRLVRNGFTIQRPEAGATVVKGLLSADALEGSASAAFFCVKSRDARKAARRARRFIGPHTPVIALQNGIGHEAIFRRAFGPRRTVIGVCYFAADRPAPRTLAFNGGSDILLARSDGNETALADTRGLLSRAGFRVRLKNSEESMLWTKAAFNAAVNPLAAACAVDSGSLAENPALRDIALTALNEAVLAANSSGHRLDYPDMADKLIQSCRNAPRQRNSMLQDLASGRPTEARAILGPLLKAARKSRITVPTLETLAAVIARLERSLAA
ncbi:MAG: 2-dehydropantoate 2-reductase [Elusimicrobiota bacterium]|mgnify:CR=1 FL=1